MHGFLFLLRSLSHNCLANPYFRNGSYYTGYLKLGWGIGYLFFGLDIGYPHLNVTGLDFFLKYTTNTCHSQTG